MTRHANFSRRRILQLAACSVAYAACSTPAISNTNDGGADADKGSPNDANFDAEASRTLGFDDGTFFSDATGFAP